MSDTLRSAAQQALEALEHHVEQTRPIHKTSDAIDALRAALAAAVAEPVAYSVGRTLHWHPGRGVNDAQLYAAPPQREPAKLCGCEACDMEANGGWRTRMSVCPQCGDKRCPRAGHHDAACKSAAVAEPVASVTECEACFTPDVCQLRGTCDHYAAERLRVAAPPQREPYDQTALGLCNACGWKAVGPDGCLNCAPQREPQWVPVAERLPEKFTEVLVAFAGQMSIASTGQYTNSPHDTNGWCYPAENNGICDDGSDPVVTHWMPLPDAPASAPKEQA